MLAETVLKLRERQGLDQFALAIKAGISPSTLSKIESGRTKSPGLQVLQKLAEALGVSVGELMGEQSQVSEAITEYDIPPALPVEKRPGRESIMDLIKEYAPSEDPEKVKRELTLFMQNTLARMHRLNQIGIIMREDAADEGGGEGEADEGGSGTKEGKKRRAHPDHFDADPMRQMAN